MKLKTLQASNYRDTLVSLYEKVKGKLAYKVAINIRKLSEELIEFDGLKTELVKKYGIKNEDGSTSLSFDSENYQKFIEDLNPYAEIELEVSLLQIMQADLETSDLTAKDILSLGDLVEV